jgi:hypothetical protein
MHVHRVGARLQTSSRRRSASAELAPNAITRVAMIGEFAVHSPGMYNNRGCIYTHCLIIAAAASAFRLL